MPGLTRPDTGSEAPGYRAASGARCLRGFVYLQIRRVVVPLFYAEVMETKLRLSPSRASDFKNCPQLYKFRVVDRLPEPPSEAQLRGTIVHKALELLFGLEPESRTRQAAADCLREALEIHRRDAEALRTESTRAVPSQEGASSARPPDAGTESLEDLLERLEAQAAALIDNYFALEDPTRVSIVGTERWVRAPLQLDYRDTVRGAPIDHRVTVELVGVIDRLEHLGGGGLVMTDYKTGTAPRPGYERDAFFGMRFYTAILKASAPADPQPEKLRLIYLQDRQVLEEIPADSTVESTKNLIAAIAHAIIRAHLSDDWRPNPGPLCDFCHFRTICPAHAD